MTLRTQALLTGWISSLIASISLHLTGNPNSLTTATLIFAIGFLSAFFTIWRFK